MHAASAPAHLARAHHRFDLRALTHVGLDASNGGIVRNLTHAGIAIQAVSPPRVGDVIRVRFELRHPKLRVEAQGEVTWVTPTGQCGIRFLDISPRTAREINAWILGNLLESSRHWTRAGSIFAEAHRAIPMDSAEVDDGLMVSPAPPKVIQIAPRNGDQDDWDELRHVNTLPDSPADDPVERDWLSQPLSGRTLAWTADLLVIVAGLLLVSLVFLSVVHELPRWPLNLEVGLGAVAFVSIFYWGFFQAFGGASLGARLARLTDDTEDEESVDADRFR